MRRRMPHRGDGFSKDFKPRKRFVNLKKLKRLLAKETIEIIAALALITICILGVISSSGNIEGSHIIGLIILWVIVLTFIAGILDLNKFRKGRDIDTSSWEEKDESEHKDKNDD